MSYIFTGGASGDFRPLVTASTPGFDAGLGDNGGMHFYVATTGDDANDGITVGTPFLTVQHALNVAATFDYSGLYAVQIDVAAGTYAETLVLPEMLESTGNLLNGADETTTILDFDASGSTANSGIAGGANCGWSVDNFTLIPLAGQFTVVTSLSGSGLELGGNSLTVDITTASGAAIFSSTGQTAIFLDTIRIVGNSADPDLVLFECFYGSRIEISGVIFESSPTFGCTATCNDAEMRVNEDAFSSGSPAAGAKKFVLTSGSSINTDMAYADWPGTVDGFNDPTSTYGGVFGLHYSPTFYVDPTGTDGALPEFGLGTGADAFQTLDYALSQAVLFNYVGLYSPTISLSADTFVFLDVLNLPIIEFPEKASGPTIIGQGAGATTLDFNTTSYLQGDGSSWNILNLTITGGTDGLVRANVGALFNFISVTFDLTNTVNAAFLSSGYSSINFYEEIEFIGDLVSAYPDGILLLFFDGGRISFNEDDTTFTGSPVYPIFAKGSDRGRLLAAGFVGALGAGSKKYELTDGASIETDITYDDWPGDVDGFNDPTSTYGGVFGVHYDINFYVDPTGTDGALPEFGLDTGAAAFKTIQYALDQAATFAYNGLFSLTINVAAGTYNEAPHIPTFNGCTTQTISGADPGTTTIDLTGLGASIEFGFNIGETIIDGFHVVPEAFGAFRGEGAGSLIVGGNLGVTIDIDNLADGNVFKTVYGASIVLEPGTSISGNSVGTLFAAQGLSAAIFVNELTLVGTPTFIRIANIESRSTLTTDIGSFDPIAAGAKKFELSDVASIVTEIAYVDWPGDVDGTADLTSTYGGLFLEDAYTVETPATGGTVSFRTFQGKMVINPAAGLATLTLNLSPNPTDGQVNFISTTQTLTALTVATTDGASIVGTITTLAANASFKWVYSLGDNTWYVS